MLIWMTTAMPLLLTLILMILSMIISKKTMMDREKMSPFECGFDPKSNPRLPFSLQFFLIAVMFLIFDIEITMVLPLVLTLSLLKTLTFTMISNIIIMILMVGLYHEWKQGALEWLK